MKAIIAFARFVLNDLPFAVADFLKSQWNQYTPIGQMLWLLALVAIGVDAGISYEFGSELSLLHAVGFALVAIAFCILPDVASLEWTKGHKKASGWIAVACIPLGMVAFATHVGYSASIRVGDMQQSSVQNAVHSDTRKAVADAEERIKFFEERIATLKSANPWVTTVSAEGLKGKIPAIEEAIAQEARRGGCGPKCLSLKRELAGIMEQIGVAQQLGGHEEMLAAAHTGLAKARGTAADTKFVSSAAANHNDTLFKAINLALTWNFAEAVSMTQREATNTGIMGMSSIAFLLLAPLFYFAAGLNRRPDVLSAWIVGNDDDAGDAARRDTPTQANSGLVRINQPLHTLPVVQPAPQSTDALEQIRKMLADLSGNTQIFHDRATARNIVSAIDSVKNQPAMA